MSEDIVADNDEIIVRRIKDTDRFFAIKKENFSIEDESVVVRLEVLGDINAAKNYIEEKYAGIIGQFTLKEKN